MASSYPRIQSTCPHDCPSTCALEVERIDENTIGRVYGAKDNRYTAGTLCAKVARYAERIHHPDRLTQPLIRTGEKGVGIDAFRPVGWDEALDKVAAKFVELTDRYGAETIWPYYFAGTMGHVNRDSINRIRNVMGYSRQHGSICTTLMDTGWTAGVGQVRGVDVTEIKDSEVVVVWGGNPVNTQVNLMSHIAQARKNGGKFVVVDAYRTGTAKKADMHLMVKPGTDGALACAVMHILFRDGYANHEYMAQYTDAPAELEAHVAEKTPQWAQEICGVPVEQIEAFAKLYGGTRKAFIRVGYGFARSRNGSVNLHAVTCLPSITGAWAEQGGGAHYHSRDLYALNPQIIQATDRINTETRILDMSRIGEVLCGNKVDLAGGPPVTGLFIQNTNPATVAPDTRRVRDGLARDDLFTCVHEQFMTETAAFADIVLPASMFLEHDDMYTGGGHTFFQVTKKVINAPGECRSNHEVNNALLRRLGAEHPAMEMNEWEVIEASLALSGYPDAQSIYDNRWIDRSDGFDNMHFRSGFLHEDKKFHFKPNWSQLGPKHEGMPELPDHFDVIDNATRERPFRLVTAPARNYLNTSFTETPTSIAREKKPTLLVHPEDAKTLNVDDGEAVAVGNDQGSVELFVRLFDGLLQGVVIGESVWPGTAHKDGLGINTLTSSDAGYPNGGAVFHDTAVWITKQ